MDSSTFGTAAGTFRKFVSRVASGAAVLLACLALTNTCNGQDTPAQWDQWRGPSRDGHAPDKTWPADFAGLTQSWKVELGPSYSGPIVVGDQVFTTETREKRYEVVSAFDRKSGKKLWESKWEGSMKVPFFAKRNGDWIRSTPAWHKDRLYVAGMRDVLVCLDAKTGEQIWKVDFPAKFGTKNPDFGFVCSPLVVDEHVYVQAGGGFVKLAAADGEVVWRTADDGGGMLGSAFSSPIFAEIHGQKQLVVQTRKELMGVSDDNGSVLWRREIPAFRGMNILTPTVWNNCLFTSSYGGKSMLVEIEKNNSGWSTKQRWQVNSQGYMSSPVVIDDMLYMHLRNQRFSCIDLETGQEKWRSKPHGEYASLVAGKDRLLALDQRGEILFIAANPEKFEVIDQHKVSENEAWAHLAICGNQLFVRELNALIAYDWKTSNQ